MTLRQENTNWSQSVAGVVLRGGKVLLVRHTYGVREGKLIVPGGYVLKGESPEDAVRRELMEETGVAVEPEGVLGIRFNQRDWYVAFRARYVSGTARSDDSETLMMVGRIMMPSMMEAVTMLLPLPNMACRAGTSTTRPKKP